MKNDRSEKTTVSLKHMAGEILNCVDYNTVIGLREIQIKIKETLANQVYFFYHSLFFINILFPKIKILLPS